MIPNDDLRFAGGSRRVFVRQWLPFFALLLLGRSPVLGTPNHAVMVEEVLLGSNEKGFVVLRTEKDNLCSYYSSRTKRYLDEYLKVQPEEKEQAPRQQPAKSTLLLDMTSSLDANNQDPQQKPVESVNARDESVSLAKVLSVFPRQPGKWDSAKFQQLATDQRDGVRLEKRSFVWGGYVTEKLFGERNTKRDWVLEEVYEDGNTLYLRAATPYGVDETQSRFLSVPVHATTQMRYRQAMQPVYLSAGSFITQEEALKKAADLTAVKRSPGVAAAAPEVWSLRLPSTEIVYVVAVCPLEAADTAEKFADLQSLLNVSLSPQSSRDFEERIPLPPAPAPGTPSQAVEGKAAGKEQ